MKRKYWCTAFACLVFLGIACGCSSGTGGGSGQNDQADQKPPESMTLMVYMIGSDLEAATAAATNDMKEMEASGIDLSKVKLLIYTGGSPKWHNDTLEVPTDVNSVFELTDTGFVQVTDFDACSMGEPDSLTRFLQYGYDNYTSEAYGLILWNHGNGPVMGYGSDILYDKDALTLPELETALAASPFADGQKFDFIGFDACLMASAELACTVDDYADYMIASQEVEPGFGWNYQFLEQCCNVGTKALVQSIVDSYITYCEEYFAQNEFFKSEVTLAAVDLSYADALETAIDTLFESAAKDVSGSYNQLALERVKTRAFGRATTGSEYDLVDMQALMTSMGDSYTEEAAAVEDIINQMVVYSDSNTVESCGLSLYYPYYNKKYYEASWKDSYSELGLFPNYISYLERYGQIWLGTDMKEYFSGKLVAEEGSSGTYTLQLSQSQAEHYADSGFYILRRMGEDAYSVVYSSPDVTNEDGLLTASFDGRVIYYGNDLGIKYIPVAKVLDEVDGEARYGLFPVLTGSVNAFLDADLLTCRMVLSVDKESGEVSVLDFSENTDEEIQTGKRPKVNLDEWVRIQFFEIKSRYLTRDEDGRILDYWEWPEGDWILWHEMALADGLNFTYEPLYDDGGEYFLMFNIMDVQGNQYSSELYPITLEEAPEAAQAAPTDAGTLEENSALIFEREGVALYLDLIKDKTLSQTSYCFRVVNSNDFSVRINIDDILVNDSISCTDSAVYLQAEAGSLDYGFAGEVSKVCMIAQMEHLSQLDFSVQMYNEENDKTLINDEVFTLHIAEDACPKLTFAQILGAQAQEQVLMENPESIKVTLLGAGYQINCNNYDPDGDYGNLEGLLKIENISDETQNIQMGDIQVNDSVMIEVSSTYSMQEVSLEPGKVYYYVWSVSRSKLEEEGIAQITSLKQYLTVQAQTEVLDINLGEE